MTTKTVGTAHDHLSRIIAFLAITWHCILISKGEVHRWAYPLLGGATLCRLLSVAVGHRYITTDASTSQQRGQGGVCRMRLVRTAWERFTSKVSTLIPNTCILQRRWVIVIAAPIKRHIINDNHSSLRLLSTLTILLPTSIFFLHRVHRHLSHGGQRMHTSLANDFGKLSSACFCLLLVPVSNFTTLLRVFRMSDVHILRMHIWGGTVAVVAAIIHGLYFVGIWIHGKRLTYEYLIPGRECYTRGYDFECGGKFVVLTGIICGSCMLFLGLTSIWRVRRNYYRVFYFVHVTLSVVMLFGLAMHDNQIVWYMAPSLLYYLASNVPVLVESLWKWIRHGGIRVVKVVHIPDSGGCVELTLKGLVSHADGRTSLAKDSCLDDNELHTIGKFCKLRVPSISSKNHPFTIFSHSTLSVGSNDEFKILFRPYGTFTSQLSKQLEPPQRAQMIVPAGSMLGLQFDSSHHPTDDGAAYTGGEVMTYVSAIHPESILAGKVQIGDGLLMIDGLDVTRKDYGEVNELFKSKQDEERVISFSPGAIKTSFDNNEELQGSGVDAYDSHNQRNVQAHPKILVNGIYTSCHQLDLVMDRHDDITIIAGGAGIVTYISLISTLRRMAAKGKIPLIEATILPGSSLGVQFSSHPAQDSDASKAIGDHSFGPMTFVSAIDPDGSLSGKVCVGDGLVSIDGLDVSAKSFTELNELLKCKSGVERVVKFAPLANNNQALVTTALHEDDEELQGNGDNDNNRGNILFRTKRIQVHWMCRDEGLIRHVVQNYFDPSSPHSVCHDRNDGNTSMSIKLVVHHTRPPVKAPPSLPATASSPHEFSIDGDDDTDDSSNSSSNGSSLVGSVPVLTHASNSTAAPLSVYEGEKTNMKQNLLPSMTFASIVFGGMWIIQYCYDNINQGRRGIENRLAPVLGILAWSFGLSILSFATTKIGDLLYHKFYAYSKLDTGMDNGEIECSVTNLQEEHSENEKNEIPSYNSMDDLHQLESSQEVLKVLHLQGRPDINTIIGEAEKVQKRLAADGSLGVFVCGPNAMNNAVNKAIGAVGENVYLYQEVFEF